MAVRFTEEQKRAIDTLDRSVLVSAAAGSGKTAVLVQRILNIILEGKANVDEMLIVTFTNAAAAEMRLRLAREIRKTMREDPGRAAGLRDQLGRLYRAYISTIDSFALRVIREFFYDTDIEPDFSICDEVQGELLRREAVAVLFEEGFAEDRFLSRHEEEDPDFDPVTDGIGFREFLRLYSEERSEDALKEDILKSYGSLRTIPDYFEWAYGKAEELKIAEGTFDGSSLQSMMRDDAEESFANASDAVARTKELLSDAGLEDLFNEKLGSEAAEITEIFRDLRTGRMDEELMGRISGISFGRMNLKKAQKEAYASIKDEVSGLRDVYKKEIRDWTSRYLVPDLGTLLNEMNATYGYTVYYLRLLEEFEKRYSALKKDRKLMDFADTEHNAVRILKNEEASDTLRKRFRYIFVDEYQDTNNIQERLISSVSRKDNVFRVGDVKQSIYRFRQAEPRLFESLYRKFSDPDEEAGIVIDLSRNFRSNDATIRYINHVFGHIMEGYDERAMLYTGCECIPAYDFIPEVHILEDTGDMPDEAEDDPDDAGAEVDEEIINISKEEAEAAYVAGLVCGLIGTEFHDTKENVVRKAEARDIVILLRSVKVRGDIVSKALMARGIEPHVEESDDYFDTVEIGVALGLLSCIDNMKRDVPLISSLHSEVFRWSPEELAMIRIAHSEYLRSLPDDGKSYVRPAFYEAFGWYASAGPDERLRSKAEQDFSQILEWRRLSRMMPLEDFVWKVLTDSGYYRMAGAMNGGGARQANLRVLADRAGKYSKGTVSSLSSYISFLDIMRQKKISTGQAQTIGSADNVVRISTIHKSKGLEYPFVIIGGLGHRFNTDKIGRRFTFDSTYGLGLCYVDPKRRYWRSTVMQRAINAERLRDGFREDLRVLYVAMTRARNKLIMVGTCKDVDKLLAHTSRPNTYLSVMRDVIFSAYDQYRVSVLETTAGQPDPGYRNYLAAVPERLEGEAAALYDEIDRRFSFEYPYKALLTEKAKYSVSEIRRKETEHEEVRSNDDEVVRLWKITDGKKKSGAADIGVAYHRIMEFIDFGKAAGAGGVPDREYIEESADFLVKNGAIDENVFRDLELDRIEGFFRSDIGKRAASAAARGTLRREKPFTLKTSRGGEDILVQGVIDCCFEEDGRMILVDYKSSFILPGRSHEEELERIRREYRVQIELYAEALSKGTGKAVAEAYLYLFTSGEALRMEL